MEYPTDNLQDWLAAQPDDPPPRAREGQRAALKHARVVARFLQADTPYRGLLLFHDLGSGKTCTSVAAADKAGRPVIVLLPAALESNYVEEVGKCGSVLLRQRWRGQAAAARRRAQNDRSAPDELEKLVRKHGVRWTQDADGTPFDDLRPADAAQVRAQVAATIRAQYRFVHYDGWSWDSLGQELGGKMRNPFDGHTVVVDEAHRLGSMIVNGSPMARAVYGAICAANRAKVLLLTATPISNSPAEIGALVNMAKGFRVVHTLPFEGGSNEAILRVARSHAGVDTIRAVKGVLEITMLPAGFARTGRRGVVRPSSVTDSARAVAEDLVARAGVRAEPNAMREVRTLPFPDTPEEFEREYLAEDGGLAREDDFRERVAGAVSHVANPLSSADFPRVERHVVRVAMAAAQYAEYVQQRSAEVKRETAAAKRRRSAAATGSQTDSTEETGDYKVLSRASCNFVFPSEVLADLPHAPRAAPGERARVQAKRMAALDPESFRTLARVARHAPKMALIANAVSRAAGPCIVYSDFRTAEGAGAFAFILRSLGFAQVVANREGGLDVKGRLEPGKGFVVMGSDADDVLLRAFNGDWSELPATSRKKLASVAPDNRHGEAIRVMVITSSSAQGISTKRVREVHLMEPFWNFTRIDQVVGRAVRYRSHADLPEDQRRVDTYLYVSTLTAKQRREMPSILGDDNGRTSDEMVLASAERKQRTVRAVYAVLREAAVDCKVHRIVPCRS